uniref:hypothetical protein n=1 Tax=Ndongobacter massiliensis TaxID=1871025 RepID=UPI0009305F54|nr:hypothetical protein [Ndongobacter massiliensis]
MKHLEVKKYTTMKKKFITILVAIVAIGSTAMMLFAWKNRGNNKNIYMTTAETEFSAFDNFLMDDVGIQEVPSYLVCKDGKILGQILGNIPIEDFQDQLTKIVVEEKEIKCTDSDSDIYNPFSKEVLSFYDLLKDKDLVLVEVHMFDCKDCKQADDKEENELSYTETIRHLVKTTFYRYYIKSEIKDIVEKYR